MDLIRWPKNEFDCGGSHRFWPVVCGRHLFMVNGGLCSAREPSSEYLRSQAGKWGLNRCHMNHLEGRTLSERTLVAGYKVQDDWGGGD